jgi:hypothetical protein
MPRIHAVAPGEQPMTLRVRWDEGGEGPVDVSGMPSEIFTVSGEEQTGRNDDTGRHWHWRERMAYTLNQAARALGHSRHDLVIRE